MATATAFSTDSVFRQRWFLVGLLLFFIAINAQYLLKVQKTDRADRSAIQRWLPQITDMVNGENIWTRHNFPYPPVMAIILAPLAMLQNPFAGALIWFSIKVGMALVCIHLVFSMLESPSRPFPIWAKILAVLLTLRPIQGDLVHNNVNLFILFLVVLSLFAFTRRRDGWAGLGLGLAIACKITPALFLPYFLWKRAWKTLAAATVALALFFFVVPSMFLGWENNQMYLASWYDQMVRPYVADGEVFYSEHNNQSLPGLSRRLLTHSASFSDYDENEQYRPLEYHNVADLGAGTVDWLTKGCLGLFVLLVIWTCRTPITARRDWRLVAEFGIVLLGMLLFSERTWKHHCVTLLVPFAVLAHLLAAKWHNPRLRWSIASTLAIAVLLMAATSTGLSSAGDRLGKLAQVYGAYVWMFLALLAMLAFALRKDAANRHANLWQGGSKPSPYCRAFLEIPRAAA